MISIVIYAFALAAWAYGLREWQQMYVVTPKRELVDRVQRHIEQSMLWFGEACSPDFRARTEWIRTCDDLRSDHAAYFQEARHLALHDESWGDVITTYSGPALASVLLLLLGVHLIARWMEDRRERELLNSTQ
jgi:hypothetical protein